MGLENLLSRIQKGIVSPGSPCNSRCDTGKQASIQVVSLVSPVSPQRTIVGAENEPKQEIVRELTNIPQEPIQTPSISSGAKQSTDSKETSQRGCNEAEILERLELVALAVVRHAGSLPNHSPEQNKIGELLNRARDCELALPLNVIELAKVIDEIESLMLTQAAGKTFSNPPILELSQMPETDRDELRNERAAIQEYDGGLMRDEAEARACYAYPCSCNGKRYWVSIHGPIVCGACHPPAQEKLVSRWIEVGVKDKNIVNRTP